MKIAAGLIASFLFLGSVANAVDLSASGIYRATSEACQKVSANDLKTGQLDKLYAGYFPSAEFTDLMNLIRSSSFKKTALEFDAATNEYAVFILKHPEFKRALKECYPNEPKMIKFFEHSVKRSDQAGKAVGVTIILVALRGKTKIFQMIQSWSTGLYRTLTLAQNASLAVTGVSMLRSDSPQPEQVYKFSDVMAATEQKVAPVAQSGSTPNSTENQLKSLRDQIAREEAKVKACGQCAEAEILNRQLTALKGIVAAYGAR